MRQVIIYPGEDSYWVAECPSLPGCIIAVPTWMNYRYQVGRHKGAKAQSFFLFPLCLCASVPALSVAYTTLEPL
jgi:hypothetical protein